VTEFRDFDQLGLALAEAEIGRGTAQAACAGQRRQRRRGVRPAHQGGR